MEQLSGLKRNIDVVLNFINKNGYIVEKTKSFLNSIDGKVFKPALDVTDNATKKLKTFKENISENTKTLLNPTFEASIEVTGGAEKTLKGMQGILTSLNQGVFTPFVDLTGGADSKLKPLQDKLVSLDDKVFKPAIEIVDRAGAKIKEVQENLFSLGDKIFKPAIEISEGVNNTVKGMQETYEAIKNVGTTGTNVFNRVKGAVSSFNIALEVMKLKTTVAAAAQWLLNTALWANPVTWIVIGVMALIAVIVLMVKNWDKVSKAISDFTKGVKNTISAIGNWLMSHWKMIVTAILVLMGPIGWGILTLVKVIRSNWDAIKQATLAIWGAISSFFTGLWNGIKGTAETCWNLIKKAISSVSNAVSVVWQAVFNWFDERFNFVKGIAESCWNWIGSIINSIGNSISGVWEGIFKWFSDKFEWIKGVINEITNNPVFKAISNGASSVFNVVSSGIPGLAKFVFGEDKPKPHATGLSYVPFDGYIAELHKGERVLTASENRAYSNPPRAYGNNTTNRGGNTFNISINGVNKSTDEIINDLLGKIAEAVNTMGEVAFD